MGTELYIFGFTILILAVVIILLLRQKKAPATTNNDEVIKAQTQLESMSERLVIEQQQNEKLSQELNENKEQKIKAQTELDALKSQLTAINERLMVEQQQNEKLSQNLNENKEQKIKAQSELDALKSKIEQDKKQNKELGDSLKNEFKTLANEIMDDKTRKLALNSKESLDEILKPFKDNIYEFQKRVNTIHSEDSTRHGELKAEIKNLLELNRKITDETTALTNALKGNSKVQGDWGEMILEKILENSNLKKGVHFTAQESLNDEAGNRLRPDFILNLPEGKQIVIDSKVSLKAFVNYQEAKDKPAEEQAMKALNLSIKNHIAELSNKNYQALVNSLDFVIMFIPSEGAFLSAMQYDNTLWNEAYNKKIIISSPTNLFAQLKMVSDLWKREDQSKQSQEIARQGAALYDKFVGFLETMDNLGKSLDKSNESYAKAVNILKTGKGNLIGRAQKMEALSIQATKKLPKNYEDFEQ